MTEIDDVSRILGKLEARTDLIIIGVNEIKDHLKELNGTTVNAHKRIDEIAPKADDWINMKKKAITVALGMGAAGGLGTTGVFKALAVLVGAK